MKEALPQGKIYDFCFYTRMDGWIKTSRFAIDASDVMGDMCRVLFVEDVGQQSGGAMFALPRRRLMEMVEMMVKDGR